MSNRYGFNPYSRDTRGYSQNWNRGFNGRNMQFAGGRQMQQKKRSGASFGYAQGDADRPYIRGWKYSRRVGLMKVIAGPNKKTKRSTSKNGRQWEGWTAKVQTDFGTQLYNALYDVDKKRVFIQDLGLILNPSAPNGGYCGSFFRRK